jgi:sugar phosphate isomerase/epimerase
MKIALDPYMFRTVPLAELPGLVADMGYRYIELSPREDFIPFSSADPLAGASLALSLQPERAELVGPQADVVRTLLDGNRSRPAHTDTPEAREKRRRRTGH